MASSASAPSPNPPLSPEDDDREPSRRGHRNRKRKVDRNSSSSPDLRFSERSSRRKILTTQRNRTLGENRISNFSLDHSPTSSSDDDDDGEKELLLQRQKARRSLTRLRKSNPITTSSLLIGEIGGPITDIPVLQLPLGLYSDNEINDNIDKIKDPTLSSFRLKWDEQKEQIGSELQLFFERGIFSDVTLICVLEDGESHKGMMENEFRIRAHQIILASFSEYFKNLLQDNPCKHPVILLKGFTKWEVETLFEFMYKGIVNVGFNQVDNLMRAADSLQIRGVRECLAQISSIRTEGILGLALGAEMDEVLRRSNSKPQASPIPHSCHNNEDVKCHEGVIGGREFPELLNLSMSGGSREDGRESRHERSRNGPQTTTAHHPGFSIHQTQTTPEQQSQSAASPPFPRRKQARPRRRSGDFIAQDLRITMSPTIPLDLPPQFANIPPPVFPSLQNGNNLEDEGEGVLDFTMSQLNVKNNNNHKKRIEDELFAGLGQGLHNHFMKNWPLGLSFGPAPMPKLRSSPMKREDLTLSPPLTENRNFEATPDNQIEKFNAGEKTHRRSRGRGRITPNINGHGHGMLFKTSPPSSPFLMNFNSPNGHGHPHSDSESNNTEACSTPPTVFSPAGFPPPQHHPPSGGKKSSNNDNMAGQQQTWPGLPLGPAPIFGRHRAQHSAPRGGPPRAWSNADLTDALHHVWNKKMTTSQASRVFGIPYNSLLMYVRGKYGKSLKLDLLKKGLDMAMENAAAATAAAKANPKSKGCTPPGRRSTSPANSPSPSNATPPHNNNNIPAKGSSPQPSLNLTTLLSQGLNGPHSPEPIRGVGHKSPESNNNPPPLGDMMSAGFNPFAVGMFGDYPPPFPFPSVAAANAALSHILPPHHPHSHHHLLTNSHRRVHNAGPSDK